MSNRLLTVSAAFIILVATTLGASPAQAAKRLPKRSHHLAYSRLNRPVFYAYDFAPYIYYETYGFNGIKGAPNANPLQFGYGKSTFGSSDFSFGTSTFEY